MPDTADRSIDWLMHSRIAAEYGLRVVDRTTYGKEHGLHSDPRAVLKTLRR